MSKVYKRTENGTLAFVDRAAGLAEINAAMIGETKKTVRTMSSISRTDYAIDYKDGRSVRLVLVDAPAPEGYTEGQAVVVQRPGQPVITGTVAHIHTAPGYVAVKDDRYRGVSTYPVNFVSAAQVEERPEEFERCTPVMGGKVHTLMPGVPVGHAYPLCRGGRNQRLTKFRITDAPLSCSMCLTYEERRKAAHANQ